MTENLTKLVLPVSNDPCLVGQLRFYFYLSLALAYGIVLSQIPDQSFLDFNNYLNYADGSWLLILQYTNDGLVRILSNEPLWLLINTILGFFLNSDAIIRTIIFLSASSIAWLVLRHHPKHFIWLILFLLLPQVLKNYLIHLRQGAAIAVFLWGWFAQNRNLRLLLFILTPFIHASFFFILALLILARQMRLLRFGQNLNIIIFTAFSLILGIGLGVLAEFLGARQANEYEFTQTDVSGLGFLLWLMVLIIMLSAGKKWALEHSFESGLIVLYLVTYWLIEVTSRIFESGLIIVLIAGLNLPGWRRYLFLFLALGSGFFAWILRIGRPELGFGLG
jgi:hypothetical protein